MDKSAGKERRPAGPLTSKRGDIEPTVYTLLIVVLAAGILLLIIYVTKDMFKIKIGFGG